MLGGRWIMFGRLNIEGLQILEECLTVELDIVYKRGIRLARPANRLVVNVREIHHLRDTISLVAQIAPHDVAQDERAEVANVGVVIHGGSTGVHTDLSRMNRLEFFLGARQSIIET